MTTKASFILVYLDRKKWNKGNLHTKNHIQVPPSTWTWILLELLEPSHCRHLHANTNPFSWDKLHDSSREGLLSPEVILSTKWGSPTYISFTVSEERCSHKPDSGYFWIAGLCCFWNQVNILANSRWHVRRRRKHYYSMLNTELSATPSQNLPTRDLKQQARYREYGMSSFSEWLF